MAYVESNMPHVDVEQDAQPLVEKPRSRRGVTIFLCLGALALAVAVVATAAWKTIQQSLPEVVPEHVTLDGSAGRETLVMTVDASQRNPQDAWHGLSLSGGVCEVTRTCVAGRCSVARVRLQEPTAPEVGRVRAAAEFVELSMEQLTRAVATGGNGLRLLCDTEIAVDVFKSGAVMTHTMHWDVPIGDGLAHASLAVQRVRGSMNMPTSFTDALTTEGDYILLATFAQNSEFAPMVRDIGLTLRADLGYVEMHEEALEGVVRVDTDAIVAENATANEIVVSVPFSFATRAKLPVLAKYAVRGSRQPHEEADDSGEVRHVLQHQVSVVPTADAGPLADLLGGQHALGLRTVRPTTGRRLAAPDSCLVLDSVDVLCLKTTNDPVAGTSTIEMTMPSLEMSVAWQDGVFKFAGDMNTTEGATTSESVATLDASWDDASQTVDVAFGKKDEECMLMFETSGMDSDAKTMKGTFDCPGDASPTGADVDITMAAGWLQKMTVEVGSLKNDTVNATAGGSLTLEGAVASGTWSGNFTAAMGGQPVANGALSYTKDANGDIAKISGSAMGSTATITNAAGVVTITWVMSNMSVNATLGADGVKFVAMDAATRFLPEVAMTWPSNDTHDTIDVQITNTDDSEIKLAGAASKMDVVLDVTGANDEIILAKPASATLSLVNGSDTLVDVEATIKQVGKTVTLSGNFGNSMGVTLTTDATDSTKLGVKLALMVDGSEGVLSTSLEHEGAVWQSGTLEHTEGSLFDEENETDTASGHPVAFLNVSRGFVVPVAGRTGGAFCLGGAVPVAEVETMDVLFVCLHRGNANVGPFVFVFNEGTLEKSVDAGNEYQASNGGSDGNGRTPSNAACGRKAATTRGAALALAAAFGAAAPLRAM